MTWEEKLAALNCLGDATLNMRKPGDWYVCLMAEIGGDGLLIEGCGNGRTPEAAVENEWTRLTSIPFDRYVRIRGGRKVRWTGYMWSDVVTD